MTASEKAKLAIRNADYKTIKEFAKTANIPYQTMARILSSDDAFWNTSAKNIFEICMSLDLSIDYFFEDLSIFNDKMVLTSKKKEMQLIKNIEK